MNGFDNIERFDNIVMLIDADNTSCSRIKNVVSEISTRGRIVVKRAYGNWKKEVLKNWEEAILSLAIKPVQVFDYAVGKNATDMALVIDAIHLLNFAMYDAFVIVSSDSDYTPLAIDLHESGAYVIGVGEKKATDAFKNSCDEFILLENIEKDTEGIKERNDLHGTSDTLEEIHNLIRIASDTYQDYEGFTNLVRTGIYIKRVMPDFDVRTYGYSKLSKLIEAFPDRYEIKTVSTNGTALAVYYKCK